MAWRCRAVPFLCGTVLAALAAGTWTTDIVAQPPQPESGPTIVVRDAGPGVVGPLLRDAVARPHAVIAAPDTGIVIKVLKVIWLSADSWSLVLYLPPVFPPTRVFTEAV